MNETNHAAQSVLVVAMSAMNKTGFDFIGQFLGLENNCLLLKDALVLNYDERRALTGLTQAHLPAGMVDGDGQTLALPLDGVAYYVALPENEKGALASDYWAAIANRHNSG